VGPLSLHPDLLKDLLFSGRWGLLCDAVGVTCFFGWCVNSLEGKSGAPLNVHPTAVLAGPIGCGLGSSLRFIEYRPPPSLALRLLRGIGLLGRKGPSGWDNRGRGIFQAQLDSVFL
jgi:hypothetical protein